MHVKLELIADGVAHISLSNPKMNVLSNQVKSEIKNVFSQVSLDDRVRVVIFTAENGHFCCGADLKEFPARIENKLAAQVWDEGHAMLQAILNTPQPTIACIHGNALGAGAELGVAFDFRIFADNAKFGFPEVTRGIIPGNGGLERLIDLIGAVNAMELIVTGKVINADEIKEISIATEVVPLEELYQTAEKLAQQLACSPYSAVRAAKKAVNHYVASRNNFDPIGRELFHQVHETEDAREAVLAFIEKRQPVFKHR